MTNQPVEIISGENVEELLRFLIDSRHLCKIRLPNTPYCWITLLSDIKKKNDPRSLLIDGVPGFEQALSHSKDREIMIEYMDPGGVLCYFDARVSKISSKMIWVECPEVIYRIQRRKFFRLKAQGGTEIAFRVTPEKEEKAKVLDYSLGGLSFLKERPLSLKTNDQLKDLCLRIPEGKGWFTVPIPTCTIPFPKKIECWEFESRFALKTSSAWYREDITLDLTPVLKTQETPRTDAGKDTSIIPLLVQRKRKRSKKRNKINLGTSQKNIIRRT